MFYDSGAPTSGMSSRVTGMAVDTETMVNAVELGAGIKLGPLKVATVDLPPGFDGVIGNDLFPGKAVSIDYRRGQLWVDDQLDEEALKACAHVQGTPAVMGFGKGSEGHLYVPANVQGVDGYLLVDTGASVGGMSVNALDQSKKDNPIVTGVAIQMMYGTFWGGYTVISDITVGGNSVTRTPMLSQPDDMIPPAPTGHALGVLPYGYLRHFLVTIDFGTQKLRLAPFVGETMANDGHLFGYGLSLSVNDSGSVTITRLIAGSPADKAGFMIGDEVTAIESVDPATVAPADRIKQVLSRNAGVTTNFAIKRGSTLLTADLISADLSASFP
jgi:hypothetical protein